MDTTKVVLAVFLTPFLLFGFLFLIWFGLDRWMGWKEKRKMGTNHTHHIILGFWPPLITYLGFHFYGMYSFLIGLIVALMTAGLYFFLSLWDIRYASIHKNNQEPSYLFYEFANPYLVFVMSLSCIILLVCMNLLVITLLNLSGDVRSYLAFFMLVCIYLVLKFLLDKKIPSWEKRSGE